MPGSKLGGYHARDTNIALYGDDYYPRIGAKGGRARVSKGFGKNHELAVVAGTIGGSIGRRGRKLTTTEKVKVKKRVYKELQTKDYYDELHNDQRERMAAIARKWANK